jgi:hypothetical protein
MNYITKSLCTVILGCFYVYSIKGQDASWKNRLYLESNFHYGFVTPHHIFITYFINDHVKGYQLNIGLHTNGEKKWHQYYNYPNIGLGFYHSGLGNNQVFGYTNALYYYVERFFFCQNKRLNLGNRISFGISYNTKKYDIENNNFNMAIGSKLNAFLSYYIEGMYRISPFLNLKLGAGFTHTSNGNIQEPNKGLNLITAFTGLQYSFNDPAKTKIIKSEGEDEKEKNQFLLTIALGRKQIDILTKKMVIPLALSAEYGRKISNTSWVGTSINLYYDPSLKQKIELSGDTAKIEDNIRISLNLSYELKMGKLSYVFQPGFYLKNSYPINGVISNRLGFRYQFNSHLVACITIKAHWLAIADFIEWGIGYQWRK